MADQNLPQHAILLLVAIGRANNFSEKAHQPEEKIRKKFPANLRKEQVTYTLANKKRTYKLLVKAHLIYKKPTRGSITWALTKLGVQEARNYYQQFFA